jgi:hypothetical protein
MSGEIVVASSRGSPSTCAATAAWRRSRNGSHRLLDQEPRAGEADLAGVVVLPGRLFRGRVEIGVPEDDERALAPELSGEGDDAGRGRRSDRPRCLRRAGERDAANAGVRRERGTGLLAKPLHDVEDTRREARLLHEV